MHRNPPRILFIGLLNDVASDRIVAAMGRLGARCAVMSTRDAFAAQTRFADRVFALPRRGGLWTRSLGFGRRLDRTVRSFRPDLLVPLDEATARMLRDPHLVRRSDAMIRALIATSLGDPRYFPTVRNRHRIVDEAAVCGLATPVQLPVTTLEAARRAATELGYPVVLKREQTCGGAGVSILGSDEDLVAAWRPTSTKATLKRVVQRLLGQSAGDGSPIVLQRYQAGQLAFHVAACRNGRVLESVSFLAEQVSPPVTGASTLIRPTEREDMADAARTLVGRLGCSGFVALDFILPADAPAVLIEMNPRPVASGHLGRLVGHDLYAALLDALRGDTHAPPVATLDASTSIALFPRELDRDPTGKELACAAILHDVPWDDPKSVAAHASWLRRRHPSESGRLGKMLDQDRDVRRKRLAILLAAALRHFDFRGPASAK